MKTLTIEQLQTLAAVARRIAGDLNIKELTLTQLRGYPGVEPDLIPYNQPTPLEPAAWSLLYASVKASKTKAEAMLALWEISTQALAEASERMTPEQREELKRQQDAEQEAQQVRQQQDAAETENQDERTDVQRRIDALPLPQPDERPVTVVRYKAKVDKPDRATVPRAGDVLADVLADLPKPYKATLIETRLMVRDCLIMALEGVDVQSCRVGLERRLADAPTVFRLLMLEALTCTSEKQKHFVKALKRGLSSLEALQGVDVEPLPLHEQGAGI